MRIQKNIVENWESLYEVGDYKKIAEENNISDQTVRKAFKQFKASVETFTIIKTFYAKREKQITA